MSGNPANTSLSEETRSDIALQRRILLAQRAALRAMHARDYTAAKVSAEAARSDSRSRLDRFLTQNNIGEGASAPRFGTRAQSSQHTMLRTFVEGAEALLYAIQAHEIGHVTQLAAEGNVADSTTFQPIMDACRVAVCSLCAEHACGQLLDPNVASMISGLAVPSSDAFMWEAVAQYERYHLFAEQFDAAVHLISQHHILHPDGGPHLPQIRTGMPRETLLDVLCSLRIEDERQCTYLLHSVRLRNMAPARMHALDLAVREFMPAVSNAFTAAQLARFDALSTLMDVYNSGNAVERHSNVAIIEALTRVVRVRAMTHYTTAKQALHLRDFAQCSKSASLAMQVLELAVHLSRAQMSPTSALTYVTQMHLITMFVSMNEELKRADVEEGHAADAAKELDPPRVGFHTSNATKHLDRHDVVLKLANSMMLESYRNTMNSMPREAPDAVLQRWLEGLTREYGALPSTVRERVRYDHMQVTARRAMLLNGARELRRWLPRRMGISSILQATAGVRTAVLE